MVSKKLTSSILLPSLTITAFSLVALFPTSVLAKATSHLYVSGPNQIKVSKPGDYTISVTPNKNAISFLKLELQYDPTKLFVNTSNPDTLLDTSLTQLQSPLISDGDIQMVFSIGPDPSKAIITSTKIVTVHFTGAGITGSTPTTITFGQKTELYSVAKTDTNSENVLAGSNSKSVSILKGPNGITQLPSPTPIQAAAQAQTKTNTSTSSPSLMQSIINFFTHLF